jgi:hypothetical protein
MLIKILCNKLLLDRATSQLASCTEPSRAGSLFSRATKTGSARARSERRADPSRAELLRARASSSSSSFFSSPIHSRDAQWYFFARLDRKVAGAGAGGRGGPGNMTNRATPRGYWKTTGKDREVHRRGKPVRQLGNRLLPWTRSSKTRDLEPEPRWR